MQLNYLCVAFLGVDVSGMHHPYTRTCEYLVGPAGDDSMDRVSFTCLHQRCALAVFSYGAYVEQAALHRSMGFNRSLKFNPPET